MNILYLLKTQPKARWSAFASAVLVLSVAHHAVNFWGLSFLNTLLVVACIPVFAVLFYFMLSPVWSVAQQTGWKRWGIFLPLALIISIYLTWRVFESPIVWHHLEITPVQNSQHEPVRLVEIKESSGGRVKFSRISTNGWTLDNGVLVSNPQAPVPLLYAFEGPLDQPAQLTFQSTAQGSEVQINFDGVATTVQLQDVNPGLQIVHLVTRYRFGIPGNLMITLTVILDLLTFMLLFTFLWLIQESQQPAQQDSTSSNLSITHKRNLALLIGLGVALHLVNFFSVPLQLGADSPTYIQGAAYWVFHHNLDGVSSMRGPGTTLLFIPIVSLFGRDPWAMKALLHILALSCVPLAYWLAWQLSGRKLFACLAGLLIVFTPDLYFYSNYLMSEIPNIFFVLLFCTLLLAAIQTLQFKWIAAALLIGSFIVLLRPENLIVFAIGGIFLLIRVFQVWTSTADSIARKSLAVRYLMQIGVMGLLGVIPILAWMLHNQQLHGFFGLSDYGGEVFYTGWVYEAEASHISFTDANSPAVKIIRDAYWNQPDSPKGGEPTGWNIYPYLIRQGYGNEQAFAILRQAAMDSIKKDYWVTLKVLAVKLKDAFIPTMIAAQTFDLPGEPTGFSNLKALYFDQDQAPFPWLVYLQRQIYVVLDFHYRFLYPMWFWICLIATVYSLYRKPFIIYLPIVLIALTRVFIPNLIGLSHWRPTVSGIVLLQIFGLAGLQTLWTFLVKSARWKE